MAKCSHKGLMEPGPLNLKIGDLVTSSWYDAYGHSSFTEIVLKFSPWPEMSARLNKEISKIICWTCSFEGNPFMIDKSSITFTNDSLVYDNLKILNNSFGSRI